MGVDFGGWRGLVCWTSFGAAFPPHASVVPGFSAASAATVPLKGSTAVVSGAVAAGAELPHPIVNALLLRKRSVWCTFSRIPAGISFFCK